MTDHTRTAITDMAAGTRTGGLGMTALAMTGYYCRCGTQFQVEWEFLQMRCLDCMRWDDPAAYAVYAAHCAQYPSAPDSRKEM